MRNLAFALAAAALLSSCDWTAAGPTPFPSVPAPTVSTTSVSPTELPTQAAPTYSAPSPTPDPYAGLTIDDLMQRSYGGGRIEFEPEQQVS